MDAPAAPVVIPTLGGGGYLEVTLDSLAAQDAGERFEVLVVDDAAADATRQACERRGVRCVGHPERRGANAARNTGLRETSGDLVLFVDDDVEAPPGWLGAYLEGARRHPQGEAFGGPIRPRLEGETPRACGREDPPITTLDLGGHDRECEVVWSANMAARRSAFERVGEFDESLRGGGEEQEWLERLRAAGGSVMYVAAAGLDHRRSGGDARLRPLMRAAYARGRAVRR